MNNNESPPRKMKSAMRSSSSLLLLLLVLRIERKESIQLAINSIMAITVISSITVFRDLSRSFREVRTMKHIPSRLEDALSI